MAMFAPPVKSNTGKAIVLYGVEGWGKTSAAACADGAVMMLAAQEEGYLTLFNAGRVPARPHAVFGRDNGAGESDAAILARGWTDALAGAAGIAASPDGIGLLAVDAIGGFERLCHGFVCHNEFDGEWGEKGFGAYQRGHERSMATWLQLLAALDRVRAKGIDVLLLGHARIRPFKNPTGPDYDRYECDVHGKTWGVTHKWADAVLFGNYFDLVDKRDEDKAKAKVRGGTMRTLCCNRTSAYDAKNRFGMPDQIAVPDDPAAVWPMLQGHFNGKGG